MNDNYQNNYVVGRGTVYFDRFQDGTNRKTGEMYFGNTPEFTINTDSETLDHYSSDHGMRVMDASVLLEASQGGTFTCDNINADNLALWFLGEVSNTTQTQQTDAKEVFNPIMRGRYYQLGTTDDNPTGVRSVTNFQMVKADASIAISVGSGDITSIVGATVVNPAGNYEIDLEAGRIYIEPDSTDLSGNVQIAVQYDVDAQKRTLVIGKSNMVYGALRMISDNPVGLNKNYYFPKVSIAPDGDYALKGDDWQVMSFTFKAMQLNNITQRVYIDIVEAAAAVDPTTQRTITISPASTTATAGGAGVVCTATVRDGTGTAVQGEAVTFTTVAGATVTPNSATTGATGTATTTVNRTTAGTATVTATLANGKAATTGTITFSAP
ncbi:Ig-like domain-containing protein [Salmonella enterica]|nr:Ig-like domain-containing protein [Salmonella enterica]